MERRAGSRPERGRPGAAAARLALLALACAGAAAGPAERFGLVIIDFDSFLCSSCQAPLVDLCRAVPEALQAERLRGILVYSVPAGRTPEAQARIVRAKWSGFRAAHGVRFPVVFDGGRAFARPASSVRLVLLSPEEGTIREAAPPFRGGEIEEIVRFLASSGAAAGPGPQRQR